MDLLIFIIGVLGFIISVILLVTNLFRKKPKKNALIIMGVSIALAFTGLVIMPSSDLGTEKISSESKLTNNDLKILKKDFVDLSEDEEIRLILMKDDMTVKELEKYKKDLKRLYIEEMGDVYSSKEVAEGIFEERFEYDIRKKNNKLTEDEIKSERIREEEAKQWIADEVEKIEGGKVEEESEEKETVAQRNALSKAEDYIKMMAYSREGLMEQLRYEQFEEADINYAMDNLVVDWNEQAAKKAQNYLDMMGYSRGGLMEQLEYEGFTAEQATYGVDAVGL